jgi:hypothetical protein
MDSRRTPTAAGFAALFVGVLAAAAIPVLLLQHDDATGTNHSAGADAVTVNTEAVPIRMVLPGGASAEPTAAQSVAATSVQLQGLVGPAQALVFSADDQLMAGTDRGGNAHVWARNGRLLATVVPASGLRISSASFTATGHQFVTVSSDGSVHFWPLPSTN